VPGDLPFFASGDTTNTTLTVHTGDWNSSQVQGLLSPSEDPHSKQCCVELGNVVDSPSDDISLEALAHVGENEAHDHDWLMEFYCGPEAT
jgi:hypothetical protein